MFYFCCVGFLSAMENIKQNYRMVTFLCAAQQELSQKFVLLLMLPPKATWYLSLFCHPKCCQLSWSNIHNCCAVLKKITTLEQRSWSVVPKPGKTSSNTPYPQSIKWDHTANFLSLFELLPDSGSAKHFKKFGKNGLFWTCTLRIIIRGTTIWCFYEVLILFTAQLGILHYKYNEASW